MYVELSKINDSKAGDAPKLSSYGGVASVQVASANAP